MDIKKMREIGRWSKKMDKKKLSLPDQMIIASATAEMLEKIEPVYDKYNKDKGRKGWL